MTISSLNGFNPALLFVVYCCPRKVDPYLTVIIFSAGHLSDYNHASRRRPEINGR